MNNKLFKELIFSFSIKEWQGELLSKPKTSSSTKQQHSNKAPKITMRGKVRLKRFEMCREEGVAENKRCDVGGGKRLEEKIDAVN